MAKNGEHWQVYCFSKGEIEPEVLDISILDGVSTSR